MSFEALNLNKPLLQALSDLGFTKPTTIQERAFSVIMSGQDVCGIAQTGTGKTIAYLLPILRMLNYTKEKNPRVLILVPTRELVVQVVASVQRLASHMSVAVTGVYGGTNINTQKIAMQQKWDVVVATPGRLYDLVICGALKLKDIRKFVIDEVDEMLNLGFRPQITNIMDLLPERRQNLLFSATITDEVKEVIEAHFNNPVTIEAAPVGTPLKNIRQQYYAVPNFHTKVNLLEHLLVSHPDMKKVLVFVDSKKLADRLFEQLSEKLPDQVGLIHSNKEQLYRFRSVENFQNGTHRILIATDVIARGLDISAVSHVISFDTPDVPENYIHRIGRTGRADQFGDSILFSTPFEAAEKERITQLMQYEIPEVPMPAEVPISTQLTEEEDPTYVVPNIQLKLRDIHDGGGAFHEKKERKFTKSISHKEKMLLKYGKPKNVVLNLNANAS